MVSRAGQSGNARHQPRQPERSANSAGMRGAIRRTPPEISRGVIAQKTSGGSRSRQSPACRTAPPGKRLRHPARSERLLRLSRGGGRSFPPRFGSCEGRRQKLADVSRASRQCRPRRSSPPHPRPNTRLPPPRSPALMMRIMSSAFSRPAEKRSASPIRLSAANAVSSSASAPSVRHRIRRSPSDHGLDLAAMPVRPACPRAARHQSAPKVRAPADSSASLEHDLAIVLARNIRAPSPGTARSPCRNPE